ncbi:MAG: DUF6448 family protein [Thermoanaerobaculales bacterium]|jgi:hypothetical protein|nr:DUF6448 family protein [Thermoanaerobaculales bacterium]
MKQYSRVTAAALAVAAVIAMTPRPALAHCDTLDGPVVSDARAALAAGDVGPVLKWVQPADEAAIRSAFARTLEVRRAGDAARELADTWFFETLVRIHRDGEGAPYTGLKPGDEVEPGIAAADQALATGEVDDLVAEVSAEVADGIRSRFERVTATREHADHNVQAGRAYVAAYVEFIHFVEGLHAALAAGHHGAAPAAAHAH